VNISNLLLARALSRQKEIAVRIALGAGRGRVLRQLLTEGMLLASLGGAAGLVVAFGGVKLLRAIAPAGVPHIARAHLGGAVLAFNIGVAVLCGILFGLAPLRGASSLDPEAALKQSVRVSTPTRRHRRLENLLIVAETAFALILLAGAGLLIRTFASLTAIAPGFHPDGVLTAQFSLPRWKYREPLRQSEFLAALLERVHTGPGVFAAGTVATLPYGGFMGISIPMIEGRPAPDPHTFLMRDQGVAVNFASGDYFQAMGIPILAGRALNSSDTAGHAGVAVVNEALVHHLFPDGKATGARIKIRGITDWLEIVGVSGDVKQGGLASQTRPELFAAAAQFDPATANTLVIRSTANPRVLGPWLRAQFAALDKDIPAPEIQTMRDRMAALIASQTFVMRLLALFAAIAIGLAAIGIYSVLLYSVGRRTHEIGIRLALGAKRADILGLVVGRGLSLALGGTVLGIAGGLALTRYLKSLLYGVTPHDPVTLAAGCALVLLAALAASWFPARRAVSQDAMATLREE
jgi:putative ABC transport system permease protein